MEAFVRWRRLRASWWCCGEHTGTNSKSPTGRRYPSEQLLDTSLRRDDGERIGGKSCCFFSSDTIDTTFMFYMLLLLLDDERGMAALSKWVSSPLGTLKLNNDELFQRTAWIMSLF